MKLYFVTELNEILHHPTKEVDTFDEKTVKFCHDMINTMRLSRGIGLAANQVGDDRRIAVIEDRTVYKGPLFLVNPILSKHGEETDEQIEGCLSIPRRGFKVSRWKEIEVKYKDKNGKEKSILAKGRLARILQHELDHLDGLTIADIGKEVGNETESNS